MRVDKSYKRFTALKWCFLSTSGFLFLLTLFAGSVHVLGDEGGFIQPGPKDKCPVCGMFVAGYPNWIAEVI